MKPSDDAFPSDRPSSDLRGEQPRARPSVRAVAVAAIALPLVLLLAGLAALWLQQGTGTPSTRSGPGAVTFVASPVPQDRPAPQFALPRLVGPGSVALKGYVGRVVVVNLWASWCGPCREEAPQLESVWRTYGPRGVQFLGVDHQDARSAGTGFVGEFGLSYPIGFDPKGEVAAEYGALGIPTTYVIDRQGRVRYRFLGRITTAGLSSVIQQLLAEQG